MTYQQRIMSGLLLLVTLYCSANTSYNFPGGLVTHTFYAKPHDVTFQGRRIVVIPQQQHWLALIGLDITTKPGQYYFTYKDSRNEPHQVAFKVAPKRYPVERIHITNQSLVTPQPRSYARIKAEQAAIRRIKHSFSPQIPTSLTFTMPVDGRISSRFGLQRIYNGVAKQPHSGLDIAAPQGTPVKAPLPGIVKLSANHYFTGKTLAIDHGSGVVSFFFHLNDVVKPIGTQVNTHDIIGHVGATGRVTGPHLHWTVVFNGAKVDPALLVNKLT